MVERVVARLAGGDVAGASVQLAALSAELEDLAAQDARRLRLHVDARMGRATAMLEVLGRTVGESGPLWWLTLAAVEGLKTEYPVLATLLASLVPDEGAAGRAANRWLIGTAAKLGLKDRAALLLANALGQPWNRFEGIGHPIVARLPAQSDPAREIERGWLLHDVYASGAALRVFRDVHAQKTPLSAELRCWALLGASRAALSRRRLEVARKHIDIAMQECSGRNLLYFSYTLRVRA